MLLVQSKTKDDKMSQTFVVGLAGILAGIAIDIAVAQPQPQAPNTSVEEIYIARSLRESRTTSSEYCAQPKTGIREPTLEDEYAFQSIALNTSNGQVSNANVSKVGSIHACFGRTSNPLLIDFFGEIVLGGMTFKGFGECLNAKLNFPEQGVVMTRCFLDIYDLPNGYVGGQLTTNTINSPRQLIGLETDPPGYTQSSIATIRLWKKRD
jgi:hypothetical protein